MGLSIEQILNECRDDVPTLELEKQASQSTASIDGDEVEKMVSFLKEASIPGPTIEHPPAIEEAGIYEKLAQAVILNGALQTIDNEGAKLVEFRKLALAKGHSEEEVDALLEKQAKASLTRSIGKGILGIGAIGGTGYGTYEYGKAKEAKKTKTVGKAAFHAGRKFQHARMQMLARRRKMMRDYLTQQQAKKSQGK